MKAVIGHGDVRGAAIGLAVRDFTQHLTATHVEDVDGAVEIDGEENGRRPVDGETGDVHTFEERFRPRQWIIQVPAIQTGLTRTDDLIVEIDERDVGHTSIVGEQYTLGRMVVRDVPNANASSAG